MATSSDTSDQNNVKSRRPAESAFKQQRLPAWQPILTAGTVLPTFFVIGIAFIPVGIGLLYFSDEVKEHTIDYTQCVKKGDTITCADYIKQMQASVVANQTTLDAVENCICEIQFNLTEDFKAEVYLYYGLTNYYQNHRRYVKSRDDNQLLGRLNQPLSTDCDPFARSLENGVRKPVAPCGAIANSLFNDTLTLHSKEQEKQVPVLRTGIAWTSDKEIKFRNPDTSAYNGSLKAAFANYTKPANWMKHVWELDLEDPGNNGFQNEDLIVWMRTAALPTFRKLYRRVNHDIEGFRTGLNKGLYMLTVEYNYPVTDFDGTKSFIISTTSLLGGKNPFLGVAYVVVGTLCLLLGIVLLIIHVRCSKRMPTSTEIFILDHHSNTGFNVNPDRKKRFAEEAKILHAQEPEQKTGLNTVDESPEDKPTNIKAQLREPQNEQITGNMPQSLGVNPGEGFPSTSSSASAYPHGRSSDDAPHSILHLGGQWVHKPSTLRIHEPPPPPPPPPQAPAGTSPERSHNSRDSRFSIAPKQSEMLNLKNLNRTELEAKKRHSSEVAPPSRSELTAAKRRASISATKNRMILSPKPSFDLERPSIKVSAETYAKAETASAEVQTSNFDYHTDDGGSDVTLKPKVSIPEKKTNEKEKDKDNIQE